MKLVVAGILSLFLFTSFLSIDDCDGFAPCPLDLSQYSLIKSYKISLKKQEYIEAKARYSIMLSKGTRYRISGCANEDYSKKPIKFVLFDNYGKVASNLDEDKGKFYEAIEYECKKTGVYYLTYSFEDGKAGCGSGSIAIKKN